MMKASWRNFFAHKGRLALSLIAVLLSVGFVTGTLVFTDTIGKTFDRMLASTSSDVSITPVVDKDRSPGLPDQTVPASTVADVSSIPGVKAAYGDVSTERLAVVGRDNKAIGGAGGGGPTIGLNWYHTDRSPVDLTSGKAPEGPGELVVDADTAKAKHLKIGDSLKVITDTPAGTFSAKITGVATFRTTNPGAALFFFDTNTAQTALLGGADKFNDITIDAAPGYTDDALKQAVAAKVGAGYDVKTKAEQEASGKDDLSFISIIRTALLGFAGIALLVGAFLIVNTFQMLVAQRTRELGLLRALGASRKQINRSVRFEALLLGLLGSTLGLAGGVGVALLLIELMSSAGLNLSTSDLTFKPATPIAGYAVGVIVTLLAAWIPARRAARITPMAALRDAGQPGDRRSSRVRNAIGLIVTALGAAALAGAAVSKSASSGGALLGLGVLVTLIGAVLLGPLLAGLVIRVLGVWMPKFFGPVGMLAQRNALRNPRRTGATAAALMIGLALVAGLSVVSSSMVASATSEMDKSVGADYIITTNGGLVVTPEVLAKAQASPGLAHVTENKSVGATVAGTTAAAQKIDFIAASPTMLDDFNVESVSGDLGKVYTQDGIALPDAVAVAQGLKVGDQVTVQFKGGSVTKLPLLAVLKDDVVFNHGSAYVSIPTLAKSLPAAAIPQDIMLFAKADKGQQDAAYKALQANLAGFPQVQVKSQTDYKKLIHDQTANLLNLVYGLLGLAIIVAILGVINTLALSVVERTREIGLIRAIGLSRRRLRRMIRLESVVIALFGAVLGVALGMGWGIAAQKVLATQGLKVLSIPVTTIVVVFIGAAVVGLLAALMPALRASRMNVLNAIAADG